MAEFMIGVGGPLAVVTGGNRGLGYEICRELGRQGYRVILTARTMSAAVQSVKQLGFKNIFPMELDVSSQTSIEEFTRALLVDFGRCDILINNAAVYKDVAQDFQGVNINIFEQTFAVNFYGPLLLNKIFIKLMMDQGFGRVVNITSGWGVFNDLENNAPAYRLSKLCLNGMTKIAASSVEELPQDISVSAVCPGWIRTDMGGDEAPKSPNDAAKDVVWVSQLDKIHSNGICFRGRQVLKW